MKYVISARFPWKHRRVSYTWRCVKSSEKWLKHRNSARQHATKRLCFWKKYRWSNITVALTFRRSPKNYPQPFFYWKVCISWVFQSFTGYDVRRRRNLYLTSIQLATVRLIGRSFKDIYLGSSAGSNTVTTAKKGFWRWSKRGWESDT